MSAPTVLLAKSKRSGPIVSLESHSLDTEEAARQLFGPGRRWGQSFCRFFGIPDPVRFLLHLQIAALFHDLGKANLDFLNAVERRSDRPQLLRHEHLSALFLHLPQLRGWLASSPLHLDLPIVTAAVLSHHIKASDSGDYQWAQAHGLGTVPVYLGHEEVRRILDRVAVLAEIQPPPALPDQIYRPGQPPFSSALADGQRTARELMRSLRREPDEARRALLLATKAGLIAADAVSSALAREGHCFDWVDQNVHREALAAADIDHAILSPRIEEIKRRRGSFQYDDFQRAVAEQGRRAFLQAACGAGKSLAAWKWAEAQARHHRFGRVIFLYPTRGTATEGFRDYVGFAPEGEGDLVSGTSRYDLEAIARNPDEPATRGKRIVPDESEERMFALRLWRKRYFSATVDQFLGFLEHSYRGLCLLPALADSALIIDEVHSFSPHMFKNLIAFLKNFDLPVLCMTATLSNDRRQQLVEAGLTCYPAEADRERLSQLREKEEHPRYRIERLDNAAQAMEHAVKAVKDNKRVLWVVNQVARAQKLALGLRAPIGATPLCYHSRYRLRDRYEIHRKAVDAFRPDAPPVIAVTTQVCEMSLDLDADVLITEMAPIASLVQRFGRANRRLENKRSDFRAQLYVYNTDGAAPYDPAEIATARSFIADLGSGDISQRDLAARMDEEQYRIAEPSADGSARFLDSGYYATPGSFREEDDYTRPCLLDSEEDLSAVAGLLARGEPYEGYVLSVPKRDARPNDGQHPALPRHLSLAPAGRYTVELGFLAEDVVIL